MKPNSMKPKPMSLDTTHQLFRSIEGKMEVITVWLLPETNSWLVNHRGCWQVWDNRAVWDNWHSTEREALRQETIGRQRIIRQLKSDVSEQKKIYYKVLRRYEKAIR